MSAGLTGSIAVGAKVGSEIQDTDTATLSARSQAEYIAALPSASSYPVYPSAALAFTVTGDIVDGCQQRTHLQCVTIGVSRDGNQRAVLDIMKAERFLKPGVLPTSGGEERVYTENYSFDLAGENKKPDGLTMTPSGVPPVFWVVDEDTDGDGGGDADKVFKYSLDGTLLGTFSLAPANDDPKGISTDGTTVWVLDEEDEQIYRYNTEGGFIDSIDLVTPSDNLEGNRQRRHQHMGAGQ